jgi:hypothetical protein
MFRLLFVLYKRGLSAFSDTTFLEAVICGFCLAYRVDQLFASLIAPTDIFCGGSRIYLPAG